MKGTQFRRIIRAGFTNFWRNGFVSFSSILTMTSTLLIIGMAMITGVVLTLSLQEFRDKADMNIYFTTNAQEGQIFTIRDSLQGLPQVASVTYTSKEDALAAFRERHQNDQLTLQALEELGDNPLGAVLTVKAKDITQYDAIANSLSGNGTVGSGSQIIEKISYFDDTHRKAIDRLAQITESARWLGLAMILIFVINTMANAFNTLRLVLYISREEISVMRLVGAGRGYIRFPFVVEGILYGLVASFIALLLLYPLTLWLGGATQEFFGGINVYQYYIEHFLLFFGVLVPSGIVLGAVSSFLAVRRYLKI
jgi:cell division transport system permease protein